MFFKKFILYLGILCGNVIFAQDTKTLLYKGNKSYDRRNYDKASTQFLEAVKKSPKNFDGHYNLANSLYKKKMYKEAEAEYQKAIETANNSVDKAAALYNQGNAMMQSGNTEKAAELYKKALKADPMDENIRKNYEIAKLKQKQQQQKQQQQNNKDQKNDQQNKDQKKGDQDKPNQSPKGKESGGQGDQKKGQGNNGGDQQKNIPQQTKEQKQLEDAILKRSENKERETAQRIINQNANRFPSSNEKNW